jgi:catechol 2,3-dioxygenase-like lactoylglutathione lyase family enzyme
VLAPPLPRATGPADPAGNAAGALLGLGGAALALHAGFETPAGDRFDRQRVGLDHLALSVADGDLEGWLARSDAAAVPNTGRQRDDRTDARYVAFHDPDGLAWAP